MKFLKANKLLISLFLAILLVLITLAVMTTARHIPGMSKYTERAYYDIPKAPLPESESNPNLINPRAKIGFIDPVVREKLLEQRNGIPLPTDILPGSNSVPGIGEVKFPDVSQPVIVGYGPVPKDSYDMLYDPKSPYKLIGRPGRLGRLQRESMNLTEEQLNKLGYNDKGYYEPPKDLKNDPSIVPFGSIHVAGEQTPSKFKTALAKILRTLEAVKKASETKKAAPMEGKPVEKTDKDEKSKEKKK
jgi:hypothetical protein